MFPEINVFAKRVDHLSEWITANTRYALLSILLYISIMQSSQSLNLEGRLLLALQAYSLSKIKSLRAAALSYDVPYTTLYRRYRGISSRRESQPNSRKLSNTEEEVLLQRILDLDDQGFPPRQLIVRETADIILANRGDTPPQTVGNHWVGNFIKRHEELRTRYNRKKDYKREICEDPIVIRGWFDLVRNVKAKYGILDDDTYNFDESGFAMGVISTSKVVTRADRKGRPRTLQPGNREWVTVVHGINSQGWEIPPLIILAAKLHQASWYSDNSLPNDWVITVSENGWTDDEIGYEWIQHFHRHTQSRTKGRYRLLILDGHGSHHSARFEEFSNQNSIITLCMPPHSSHILQPLDVGCFGPLKASYGAQIEKQIRLGVHHITKNDFLYNYYPAHVKAMTEKNIKSGFVATGLVPFNPERVFSELNPIIRTPSPIPTQSSIWESKTPQTAHEIKRQAKYIQEQRRRRTNLSRSPTDQAFQQLLKGFEKAVYEKAILATEVKELRAVNKRQKQKRARRRTIIAEGGVLSISQGQDLVARREVQEQTAGEVIQEEVRIAATQPRKRAPAKCSCCYSLDHNARTCPIR